MKKPVHTIILDAGPILQNEPPVSVLLGKSEHIVTVPSVITEIKDSQARHRLESTLLPFMKVTTPKPESVKFVVDFSRRTGDLPVLSKPDIQVLALAYELECARNGGDWRLRKVPGQKKLNGSQPKLQSESFGESEATNRSHQPSSDVSVVPAIAEQTGARDTAAGDHAPNHGVPGAVNSLEEDVSNLKLETLKPNTGIPSDMSQRADGELPAAEPIASETESDDAEGWITPKNLRKQQAKDQNASTVPVSDDQFMQVATITTDFAMQVRILQ